MPIGRRRSSAIWPSSPAARASRANPRSSSTGSPRSARAAPQTPAPLSGQPAAEHLLVRAADRLEQPQVRAAQALLLGDPDEHGGPGVLDLVHRVAETRDVPAGLTGAAYGVEGDRVPAGVVGGCLVQVVEGRVQVGAAVLGDPEEARPAAQQAGGERALQRVGRGEVREAGGDRRRGEAVVGQRDQHGLEDADLLTVWAGASPPARTPARRSRPCPSGRRSGPGRAAGSRRRWRCRARSGTRMVRHASSSQARISAPCSSSAGGGRS